MKSLDYIQFFLYVVCLIAMTPFFGKFMAKVFEGENIFLRKPLGWLEKITYRVAGVDQNQEMGWKEYAVALFVFNVLGIIISWKRLPFLNLMNSK
ncbi:MAG: potassium-transporting ATPase subunit KdpA [Bacteriovoracaceae bacterium]|nr:potassium-transporting ATPase subunit KdpA [Bacteriovoracaceae bacterium]